MQTESIELIAISNKGKNRTNEILKQSPTWDGKTWLIMHESNNVLFNPIIGGWVYIIPSCDENVGKLSKFARWFNMHSDEHFRKVKNV